MDNTNKHVVAHLLLATICAEHTRQVQVLALDFYSGKLSMQQYRKRSRELTQQLVNTLGSLGGSI